MERKLFFHNNYHYGDCLFSLHILNKISEFNNIACEFYCNSDYHFQLKEFTHKNLRVVLSNKKNENSFDLWGGTFSERANKKFHQNFSSHFKCDANCNYEDVYKKMLAIAQLFCEDLNLKCPFKIREDLIFDEEILTLTPFDQKFHYLLINSYCLSGQVKYSPYQQDLVFLDIINKIKSKNKTFITTKKLLDYPCTSDYNFTLVQIGQLSKNCKILLGVPTAPFLVCLNKYSLLNYKNYLQRRMGWSRFLSN